MTCIGILSDTHLNSPLPWFVKQVQQAFADCSIIFHAGDLISISILDIFQGKEVHAVHGNMCEYATRQALPTEKVIKIDGYTIALCHGAGARHNIEERMWNQFPAADCIVYGHTHFAVNHRLGKTLFVNPGSFAATGRYGAPGSYAILTIDDAGLNASLHQFTGAGL
ncbi:MAG: metallophosphatase family protein [Desulfocapsa sp.]|nr:metallophosphatase family protein [Desulfocapsa sp.]